MLLTVSSTISNLPPASQLQGTEAIPLDQPVGGSTTARTSPNQLNAFNWQYASAPPPGATSYWDIALLCPRILGSDGQWHNLALNT